MKRCRNVGNVSRAATEAAEEGDEEKTEDGGDDATVDLEDLRGSTAIFLFFFLEQCMTMLAACPTNFFGTKTPSHGPRPFSTEQKCPTPLQGLQLLAR